jgi:hypothetical protein
VELAILGDPDGRISAVAQAAAAEGGVELSAGRHGAASAWWKAGVADAIERAPALVAGPRAYDAARSPRSTRGATRA